MYNNVQYLVVLPSGQNNVYATLKWRLTFYNINWGGLKDLEEIIILMFCRTYSKIICSIQCNSPSTILLHDMLQIKQTLNQHAGNRLSA